MSSLESPLKPYAHKSLESSDTIRILRLYPAQSHSHPLEFDLEYRARSEPLIDCSDTALYYDAVSYVWGRPMFSHVMRSRDQDAYLKITLSVDTFLRQLRKTSGTRFLWVDAICLNQEDNDEKSVQVPLMGDIYSQARKVRIWLGEADASTYKVFRFLGFVTAVKSKNGMVTHSLVKKGLMEIFGSESSQALEAILCNPWFGRRWIIQEAVLGHSVVVHQGIHKISWEWFTEGLIALLDIVTNLQLSETGKYSLAITSAMSSARDCDILDCLWDFDKNTCSDPRDRIFALYGFTTSSNASNQALSTLAADYNRDWTEVYSDFAARMIERKGLHFVLPHLMAFGGLSEFNSEMPSWVPNWSRGKKPGYGRTSSQVRSNERDKFRSDAKVVERNSECMRLKITVLAVGDVEAIHHPWPTRASRSNLIEFISSWWSASRFRLRDLLHTTWCIFGPESEFLRRKHSAVLESYLGLSQETEEWDLWRDRDWINTDDLPDCYLDNFVARDMPARSIPELKRMFMEDFLPQLDVILENKRMFLSRSISLQLDSDIIARSRATWV